MKDHLVAQIINQLRDIAIEFHATEQLRERIAEVIHPLLAEQEPVFEVVNWVGARSATDAKRLAKAYIAKLNKRYNCINFKNT